MRHLLLTGLLATASAHALEIQPTRFETAGGESVAAEEGRFTVPVRHDRPAGPHMTLAFVRFPATTDQPGPPIVYLAGGPGGSGIDTARGGRFPLFMALRRFGDVIALDQRGTGRSEPPPGCRAAQRFSPERPFTEAEFVAYAREAVGHCERRWAEQGVDLAAYTTWESAGDLEVLRRELGVEKLVLWGISYGTHLALAAVKRLGDEKIERLVLASPEGLDDTVKLPARWDGYLQRLAARVAADERAAAAFPDIVGTLRSVLERLETEPAEVEIDAGTGEPVRVRFGPVAVRYMLAFMGKNPDSAAQIPAFIYGLAAGHYGAVAQVLAANIYRDPTAFSPMPLAMDIASGISPARLERVREQAVTALMGDVLNYPMPQLLGAVAVPDLGDGFRAPLASEVPALILTGTLDGRTFPEAHAEIRDQFSRAHHLVIDNAGHDLFMVSPSVTEAILTFMAGGEPPATLSIDPPAFLVP